MYRLYDLNEQYFSHINTNAKSYILGLIFSDGSIENADNNSHKQYRLRFSLQLRDVQLLILIKKELNYTGKIRKTKKYCYLEIHSKSLITHLCKYGLTNNKSLTIKPPKNLPKKFIKDFIRGLFDGDGCAALYSHATYQKPYLIMVGTKSMMLWLKTLIDTKIKLRKQFNSWILNVGGFKDIKKFIKLMESPYGLNRKTITIRKIAAYIEKSNRKT